MSTARGHVDSLSACNIRLNIKKLFVLPRGAVHVFLTVLTINIRWKPLWRYIAKVYRRFRWTCCTYYEDIYE